MDMREFLDAIGATDWECDDDGAVLYCPDGEAVEPDGVCPDGHKSPLITAEVI